ncbi:Na+/H+ antiporter NhaA [Pseudomonas capsici]|uniref:Na+/H+ antiporter NhaA n=1 Tax=Pseudomonas capsici TaxID=2810614 RepID=UPI0021F160FE|nr:Na+/H+ antiporter NhaA [Pseudomonas capsici]MCV4287714.1 Na+/H+ antiporter NhaA [Pseudomonas capsici]
MPAPNTPASTVIPRPQILTSKALAAVERFSHIEAVSGIALVVAAIAALLWANGSAGGSYESFWHTQVAVTIGSYTIGQSLHFLVNDGLMTIFFLVVGMEIRQEIQDGALSNAKMAMLPIGAALGGVLVPAGIYVAYNLGADSVHGWAVPTATDIAFAVGVLALLGKSIPANLRVFLLALAIIDDIAAILIIAFFYTTSLDFAGLAIACAGLAMVFAMQRMGIGSAWVYLLPGIVMWGGLLKLGVHPTLAGVVLGLITPVRSTPSSERPMDLLSRAFRDLTHRVGEGEKKVSASLKQIRFAEREVVPPVQRVQERLHPWVAFAIMPLFALANAGVNLQGVQLGDVAAVPVVYGIVMALVFGKPIGVLLATFVLVRSGLCKLPSQVTWGGVMLVGLLAGIGFTMSIFIAGLAFDDDQLLGAAKLSVLCASAVSAVVGLLWGLFCFKWGVVRRAV